MCTRLASTCFHLPSWPRGAKAHTVAHELGPSASLPVPHAQVIHQLDPSHFALPTEAQRRHSSVGVGSPYPPPLPPVTPARSSSSAHLLPAPSLQGSLPSLHLSHRGLCWMPSLSSPTSLVPHHCISCLPLLFCFSFIQHSHLPMLSTSATPRRTPLVWWRGRLRQIQTLPDSWEQGWGRWQNEGLAEPRAKNNKEPKAIMGQP